MCIRDRTGDDPVPVKFVPKGTQPQQEVCASHVLHAERCAVGVSRPFCKVFYADRLHRHTYKLQYIPMDKAKTIPFLVVSQARS